MKTLILFASILAASCGGKSTPTTTPTGGEGSGGGSAVATPLPVDAKFDALDHEQRIQFMKEVVMPAMEPLFKNHDAKKYAEFGCKTCHGASAEQGKFDMPNEALPKLFGPSMPKYKKEDLEWMGKEIKPTMAKLLKEPEYTEENPKGFGCLECHSMEPKQ